MNFIKLLISCCLVGTGVVLGRGKCASYSRMTSGKADYYITGLFPFYKNVTPEISRNGLLYMEISRFTIEQANKHAPYKIGYRFYDTCGEAQLNVSVHICADILLNPPWRGENITAAKEGTCTCDVNTKQELDHHLGVVGPASSAVSQLTSDLLSAAQLPIVSYASTSPELSNRDRYPRFLRTIPNDLYQANIIVDLLKKFNWNLVSLVATDNLYGRTGSDILKKLFKENRICLEINTLFNVPYDPNQIRKIVKHLKEEAHATVIIVWALGTPTKDILESASELKLYNRTWIFTEALGTSTTLKNRDPNVVSGSFTIRHISGIYSEFEDYFFNLAYPNHTTTDDYTWLETYFNSKRIFKHNSTNVKVRNYTFNKHIIGYVRNSVMAYINALRAWIKDFGRNVTELNKYPPITNRTLFYKDYLCKVNFTGLNGEAVYFDEYGNISEATYEIFNLKKNSTDGETSFHKMALYRNHQFQLLTPETAITWATTEKPESQCATNCSSGHYSIERAASSCCLNCVKCENGFAKSTQGLHACTKCPRLTFSNENRTSCYPLKWKNTPYGEKTNYLIYFLVGLASALILVVIVIFVRYRNSKIVKASSYEWSICQLVVQIFLSLSGLTVTIEVTKATCIANAYLSGVCISIILAIIYIKARMLEKIFTLFKRISTRERIQQIKLQLQTLALILFLFILMHVFIYYKYEVSVNTAIDYEAKTTFQECVPTAQTIGSSLYILCLALVCSVQTFKNRSLPSLYNEGKVMMYTVFVLTISIILILMIQLMVHVHNRPLIAYLCFYVSNLWILMSMFFGKLYHLWRFIRHAHAQSSPRIRVFLCKSSTHNNKIRAKEIT